MYVLPARRQGVVSRFTERAVWHACSAPQPTVNREGCFSVCIPPQFVAAAHQRGLFGMHVHLARRHSIKCGTNSPPILAYMHMNLRLQKQQPIR
jgi:hypothetical protein